jgi:antitoxin HicB
MNKAKPIRKRNPRTGSTLESALLAGGVLEESEAFAIKSVIAWELEKSMLAQGLSKQALAKKMSTSRSQLDRLLDPKNAAVQLDTVVRAARALGKRLEIGFVAA